jgi:uncharacterized protein YcfJ
MKLLGIFLLSVLWLATPAIAQDRRVIAHPPPTAEESTHYGWADVLRVDPVYDDTQSDARAAPCFEDVPPPAPVQDHSDKRAGGTIVGAIVGGVIGSMFGHGDGRKATIAAGAVAGGVVGNNVAAADDAREAEAVAASEMDNAPPAGAQRHCGEPKDANGQRRIVGYDVEYRYRGEIYLARLAYDPGDRLRVRVSVTPAD